MGSVTSISPAIELERFFEHMYDNQTGYVYSPTKDPETERFEQYFFEWPTEKERLIEHILQRSPTHEVYYGPGLFNSRSAEKESFKGTSFVWAEFDGTLPTGLNNGLPEPSIKIQSSTEDHQHWYWKLEGFITDQLVVEDISQRLAYHLSADLGCWNANRVLRPPGTTHHESARQVIVLRWDVRTTPIGSFVDLPSIPIKLLQESDINYVPQVLDVIAKYKWNKKDFKFFREKEMQKGSRSSALTKLGHICMEIGMSNSETLSILLNADSRWGKFSKRKDQKRQLLGIINFCRSRHPVDPVEEEVDSPLRVYTYEEFINTELKLEWVIEGLIHKKGFFCLFGPPDIGKSQISLRLCEKLAKGEQFLKWKPTGPMRMMFISMEMPHEELLFITEQMKMGQNNDLLNENFLLMPIGSSIHLSNKVAQGYLNKVIETYQPDGIVFDSLGVAVGEDITSEKVVFDTLNYVHNTIRKEYGAFVWFIHHPRKEQIGNKKPNKLSDMYGNQYIGAAATGVMSLWKSVDDIEVSCLKLRMAEKFKPFKIRRIPGIDFKIVEGVKVSKEGPIFNNGVDLGDSI